MKRSFGGIQFEHQKSGYSRPGDGLSHWLSKNGIKLFCGRALRGPLSAHWEGEYKEKRAGGMSAVDTLQNLGILERPHKAKQ